MEVKRSSEKAVGRQNTINRDIKISLFRPFPPTPAPYVMSKLYIIGDSFTRPCDYSKGFVPFYDDWCRLLQSYNPHLELLVDGRPSRDVQTIIDIWIKLLPQINDGDYLIICLPTFVRTRLPLMERYWETSNLNSNIINRFIGTSGYELYMSDLLDDIDGSIKSIRQLDYQSQINATKSSVVNQLEIIESLIKVSKSKTIVFSWDVVDYHFDWMLDKTTIEKGIGVPYETLHDVWIRTNGEKGMHGDGHWSGDYNKLFSVWMNTTMNKVELVDKKLI